MLVSAIPGGTISYEHRCINGRGASAGASVSTQNLWSPAADLSYRFMYQCPYWCALLSTPASVRARPRTRRASPHRR